jgi:hypothetical protein
MVALIVTPDGFLLAYEVLPGNTNTADCTTLRDALRKIEAQYGPIHRSGISSPKGRLSKLEKALLNSPGRRFATIKNISRDELEVRRRASKAGAAWRLIAVEAAEQDATFTFVLNRNKRGAARGAICCAPIRATRIRPSCGSSTSSSSRSRSRSRTSRTTCSSAQSPPA